MSNKRVVTELSKLWESVALKTKQTSVSVDNLKTWVSINPALNTIQTKFTEKYDQLSKLPSDIKAEEYAEKTKQKVGKFLTAYEETIGISEVRSAHARVLSAEAKFIDSQEKRRLASKELSLIHNKLMEIRAELDRTHRGDESYLELIKQEISATKEERLVRQRFEELERTEREVFSELSSALRFSHEKERAQNEKTKYWSIVGSIIGATLGVLGSTINNKMKQNHIKHIQEETSAQVTAILTSVNKLSEKINDIAVTPAADQSQGGKTKSNEAELEKLTKSMQDSIKTLQKLIISGSNTQVKPLDVVSPESALNVELLRLQVVKHKWEIGAVVGAGISYLLYKLM